jgi:hypothetical protein
MLLCAPLGSPGPSGIFISIHTYIAKGEAVASLRHFLFDLSSVDFVDTSSMFASQTLY